MYSSVSHQLPTRKMAEVAILGTVVSSLQLLEWAIEVAVRIN